MSFGINGPDNIPAIQKAQNMMNNGGGGNLGYFQQERKKKDEEDQEEKQDVFEFSGKKDDNQKEDNLKDLDSIGSKIKSFWMAFHTNLNEDKKTET